MFLLTLRGAVHTNLASKLGILNCCRYTVYQNEPQPLVADVVINAYCTFMYIAHYALLMPLVGTIASNAITAITVQDEP